jgi:hypothetical protein
MHLALVLTLSTLAPTASAASCDYLVKRAESQEGAVLVKTYSELLKCDQEKAQASYDIFMKHSGDVGTLVDLSITAISAKAYTPVWSSLEKIPDYSARDEVAKGVGSKCAEHPEVVTFIKGAYYGLRGRQFGAWENALITCTSDELVEWMAGVVAEPPVSTYNAKYDAVITAYVKQLRGKSLPTLERAAVAAATNGGPFSTVVEKMETSVQPVFGEKQTDEEKELLEKAMVKVAGAVVPEQAAMVADRLYNSGNETAAASLLPRVYPDRVQGDGTMLYAAASVETCDDEAVIHYSAVYEPSKRWSLLTAVDEPMRGAKARLKCEGTSPWPVVTTPEPIEKKSDVNTWVEEIVAQWEGKVSTVKTRAEKDVILD